MKRLLILAMFLQAGGQPINVPVQNPSFSEPTPFYPDRNCGFRGWPVSGWAGNVSSYQLAPGNPCGISAPPDGHMGLLENATTTQDLGVKPFARDGVYVLSFEVANYFYWYSARYTETLSVGTTQICSAFGIAMGDLQLIPLVCPAERIYNYPGNLTISLSAEAPNGNFWPLMPSNVSLTFTPTN